VETGWRRHRRLSPSWKMEPAAARGFLLFAPFGVEGRSFGTYSMAVHAYRWSAAGRSGETRWRPAGRQDRSRSGRLEEKEAEAAEGWEREGSCFGSGPGGKKRLVTGTGRGGSRRPVGEDEQKRWRAGGAGQEDGGAAWAPCSVAVSARVDLVDWASELCGPGGS
jgi:hypothetical protein